MTLRTIRNTALLAATAAIALSASGCVIEEDSGPAVCYPDLYVSWEVVGPDNTPRTCAQAGAATVTAQVGGLSRSVPCPASASAGDPLYFPLDQTGTYDVNVQLRDANGAVLSQTGVDANGNPAPPPSIPVGCGGTQTPVVQLGVAQ